MSHNIIFEGTGEDFLEKKRLGIGKDVWTTSSLRIHKRLSRACSGEARTNSHICKARALQQQNVLLPSWRDHSPHPHRTHSSLSSPLKFVVLFCPHSSSLPREVSFPVLINREAEFQRRSVQFSSVAQSCPTLCDPMNRSTPGLPVHHHLPEFTQTHIH